MLDIIPPLPCKRARIVTIVSPVVTSTVPPVSISTAIATSMTTTNQQGNHHDDNRSLGSIDSTTITSSFNPDDLRTVKVENKWNSAINGHQYAKIHLPVCSDPSHKGMFLYLISQFVDATYSECLHLTISTGHSIKFFSVPDGDL
eukprot:scaffold19_cov169-Amphora_coffeaeformis.AAC.11